MFPVHRSAEPDTPLRRIYRYPDVPTVEMASRICRTPDKDDDEIQDKESVKLAEKILKVSRFVCLILNMNTHFVRVQASFFVFSAGWHDVFLFES